MTVNPVPQTPEWTFRRVVWATLVLVSVIFCFWLIIRFYRVVFILFIAIVVGTVIRPVVNWMYQRGISRFAAVIIIYLVLLILFGAFLWLLFPLIFQQGVTLTREIPGYYQSLRESLLSSNQLLVRLGELLPAALPTLSQVQPSGEDMVANAGQAWTYVVMISQILFTNIVILALTLYWTLDGPRIIKSFMLLIPKDQREETGELVAAMETKLGYYIAGQGILCLSIGVLAFIAYSLIGLPNAFVLALAAGVLEIVPMVGPVLGAVPAALVAVAIGPDRLIWVVIASIVIQQLENSVLVPRIMKNTVGVNPFVTLLALFAFSYLFGIAGALMAIPLAAIAQLILNHFVFRQVTVDLEPAEGRDYSSRLRYETQDLIQDLRKQARNKKRGTEESITQIEQVMDEIETIATDLDGVLAQANYPDGAE